MSIREPQMKWNDCSFDEKPASHQAESEQDARIVASRERQSNLRHIESARNGIQESDAVQYEECRNGIRYCEVE